MTLELYTALLSCRNLKKLLIKLFQTHFKRNLVFVEIDMEALSHLMQSHGISRSSLSRKLGVSEKTIQRWRTGSVRRLKPEKLNKLASIFNVDPQTLVQKSSREDKLIYNRNLEEVCSESFVHKIRAFHEWEGYRKVLKTFNPNQLLPRQRFTLWKHLGFASVLVGKVRAAKFYLDSAWDLAQKLNLNDELILIANWKSTCELISGNYQEAQTWIRQSEKMLEHSSSQECLSDFFFKKGLVLHSLEKHEEAFTHFRLSILIDYKSAHPRIIEISNKYTYLGETYLRMRDFRNAEISFRRAEKTANQSGWVIGQIHCHFCFAIIKLFMGQSMQEVRRHWGRAKRFIKHSPYGRLSTQSEQIEFLYYLFDQNVEEAKRVLLKRLELTRSISIHFSYAVLDTLLFSKLHPDLFRMRPSLINKADEFFRKNDLKKSLAVLEYLRQKERITLQEAMDIYLF